MPVEVDDNQVVTCVSLQEMQTMEKPLQHVHDGTASTELM